MDPERQRIVNNRWRPVQFIFAGKAHPADEQGKQISRRSTSIPMIHGSVAG